MRKCLVVLLAAMVLLAFMPGSLDAGHGSWHHPGQHHPGPHHPPHWPPPPIPPGGQYWPPPPPPPTPSVGNYWSLTLINGSYHNMSIAVCYKLDNGDWYVRGWWILGPNQRANLGQLSRNRKFYIFAESPDGAVWGGPNNTTVTGGAFNFVDGQGDRTVGFMEVIVPDDRDNFSFTFNN